MHLRTTTAFWALLASTAPYGLEVEAKAKGLRRNRKLAKKECTIMAIELLPIEGGPHQEMIIGCELDPVDADGIAGIAVPVDGTDEQLNKLRQMIEDGDVTPAHDSLDIEGAEIDNHHGINIAPGLDIADMVRKNVRRRLKRTLGDLKMLLVRVTDVNGLVYPDAPELMR